MANWETDEFGRVWQNDEAMYVDFIEYAAGYWVQEDFSNNLAACGEAIVTYAHDWYTGEGDGHMGKNFFPRLETDEEWAAIDRQEIGEAVRDAVKDSRYSYLV